MTATPSGLEPQMLDEHIIIQSRLISINSRFATRKVNGRKHSSLLFDFNSIAIRDAETLYHTIAIQSAEIPASYYNVNAFNNEINITQGAVTTTITIPKGNYNANTFATSFMTLFNAVAGMDDATLAFNTTTGCYSFMSDQAGANLTINLASTTANVLLGIDPDENTGSISFNYAADDPTFFPLPANFLGVTKIKVLSDALSGGNYDSKSLGTTTLVDTISVSGGGFGLTDFTSLGRESFVKAKRIDEIDIQLLDQDNNVINFNGINWTMTLLINTHTRALFSNETTETTIGTILNDRYVAELKAAEKTESVEKELDDVEFDII